MHFGHAMPQGTIIGWAARAIFHPGSDRPLDIPPDRQSTHNSTGDESRMTWLFDAIRRLGILAEMQALSKWFGASDTTGFVKHYATGDPDTTIVACGSPQGSYGYFYVCVAEVPTTDAPAEKDPPEKIREHERFVEQARRDEERRVWREKLKAERKLNKLPLNKPADPPPSGTRISSEVGVRFVEWINQQYRNCLVVDVKPTRIRIQFEMPRGVHRGWRKRDADGMYSPAMREEASC